MAQSWFAAVLERPITLTAFVPHLKVAAKPQITGVAFTLPVALNCSAFVERGGSLQQNMSSIFCMEVFRDFTRTLRTILGRHQLLWRIMQPVIPRGLQEKHAKGIFSLHLFPLSLSSNDPNPTITAYHS